MQVAADGARPADAMGNPNWTRASLSLKAVRISEREDSSACSPMVRAQEISGPTVAEIALDEGPYTATDADCSLPTLPSLNAVATRTSSSYQTSNLALSKEEVSGFHSVLASCN